MIAALFENVDTTSLLVIVAVVGYVVKTVGEGRGWFETSAGLRVENTDLLRRNVELESTVGRHEATIRGQGEKIIRLEEQVKALEKLDQSAVLAAIVQHEIGAVKRAETTHTFQSEAGMLLERIAKSLEATPAAGSITTTDMSMTTTKTEGTLE